MRRTLAVFAVLLLFAGSALAQEAPKPPGAVTATDRPHDRGEVVLLSWELSPSDDGSEGFDGYVIERIIYPATPAIDPETGEDVVPEWVPLNKGRPYPAGKGELLDRRASKTGEVEYRITAQAGDLKSEPVLSGRTTASPDLFEKGRYGNLLVLFIFAGLLLGWIWAAGRKLPGTWVIGFFLYTLIFTVMMLLDGIGPIPAFAILIAPVIAVLIPIAKRGSEVYIRPIPAIQAVEEAIGRATEMGKPILYVPGISTIQDVATIAALNILAPVAQKAAQYDSKLIVPNYDPIVFTITQEVVKEAYLQAGRPDAYRDEDVFYLSARQFAYAAAVNGIMVREKPATNFFLGMFFAESLLLAETGNMTGAIQIAGTDAVTQLPFFIVACDYTLIGEELYAAGAYMGDDPKLTGSLKGQDWSKAICIFFLIAFALLYGIWGAMKSPEDWSDGMKKLPKTLFEVRR